MIYPACGALRGWFWSDMAMSIISMGLMGASSDDLLIHGEPTDNADTALFGSYDSNRIIPSQNNLTEQDRQDNTGDADRSVFIYSRPKTYGDWQRRFTCTATGFRAGGQDRIDVDGKPYIRQYAPRRGEANRYNDAVGGIA